MHALSFREAVVADIPQIQLVRNSVRENMLSDPSLVTDAACCEYLTIRGIGWVQRLIPGQKHFIKKPAGHQPGCMGQQKPSLK